LHGRRRPGWPRMAGQGQRRFPLSAPARAAGPDRRLLGQAHAAAQRRGPRGRRPAAPPEGLAEPHRPGRLLPRRAHPSPAGPVARSKQLLDMEEFRAAIAAEGAELVLHGHAHVSNLAKLKTPKGEAAVVGVPSASARADRSHHPSRYHIYRIARDGTDWRIEVEVRGVSETLDRFRVEPGFSL